MSAVAMPRGGATPREFVTPRDVAGMADQVGVLSVYVTSDPHWRAGPELKPPWELELRHGLDRVYEQVRQDETRQVRPRGHARAVAARLDALHLHLDLERLLDPATSGQGRALFAAVASGTVHTVSLQVPLGDRVVLEPRAYLRPLLAAWSTAGPAGVGSVSADQVRVVDLRFGWAEEVDPIQDEDPAARLAALVRQRGWVYLALTGEAGLVHALRDRLPPGLPAEVVTLDHPVATLPAPKLAGTVQPALDEARQRHHRDLAERARSNALSANTGACGLGETLGALQQGRVAHLLLDRDRQWSGSRAPDGFLAPAGEVPPGAPPEEVATEPHLGERMIELAFRDNAQVTLLEPAAAAPLADVDGVGALLRW